MFSTTKVTTLLLTSLLIFLAIELMVMEPGQNNKNRKIIPKKSKFKLALSGFNKRYIDEAVKFYLDRGVDPMIISGIFGNISKESEWNPNANALDNGIGDYYGLVQMSPDMRKEVKRVYGKVDANTTHLFIYDAMTGNKKISLPWRNYMTLKGGYWNNLYHDAGTAAMAFGNVFERPSDKYADWDERMRSAQDAYDYIMSVVNTNNNNFANPIKTTVKGDGNKVMTVNPEYWEQQGMLKPALRQQNSDVVIPLKDNSPSIQMPKPEWQLDDVYDMFDKGAVAIGKKKSIFPRISEMLDYGKEKYFADLLGVPSLYDQSNQPGYYFAPIITPRNNYFADGKTPYTTDTDPIFVDKSSPDAKWHENWLNNRTLLLKENYNIDPLKFDEYGTGSVDLLMNNLKSTKEYRGVDNVNKEYGYDFPMGYLGHNMDSFTGGVTITGEGNDNNIIMYPSATLPPESNPQYIMPDRTLNGVKVNPNMTDLEIERWNNGIKRRTRPELDRYGDMIHERTHALSSPLKNNDVIGTLPQDYKIDEINKRHGLKSVRPKYSKKMSSEEYHMIPNEIYAGLNEARYKLGLSPDHVVTKEEILKWKKEGLLNQFLEDKPDDVLLEYFNEVASNPNPLFNPSNVIQAYGMLLGKLLHARDGKSPIHIKPLNVGKLTKLKARTGKSESELYNDGNPAHKKMVVFARNARKWKH